MRHLAPLWLIAVALTGCVSAEQRNVQDDQTCTGYGAAWGTDAYIQCRSSLNQVRAADGRRRAAALQAFGRSLQEAGAAQQPVYAPAIQAPIMCQSRQQGAFYNTTCQ